MQEKINKVEISKVDLTIDNDGVKFTTCHSIGDKPLDVVTESGVTSISLRSDYPTMYTNYTYEEMVLYTQCIEDHKSEYLKVKDYIDLACTRITD